jgi:gamma-glutamylaminecyclotransferase
MFNEPGVGCQIIGEPYEVDDKTIENLDRLESGGEPGNFRAAIQVEPIEGGGSRCLALACMKARELADPVHSDHLQVYEDRRFIPFDQRP